MVSSEKLPALIELSARAHGHLCPGQVLGVRLALLGLALLGFEAPLDEENIKKVVVFVEIDRCAADALATVTGVKLGRRSLRFKDYGLMAATFLHLPDGKAFRLAVSESCREKASRMFPQLVDRQQREIQAYQVMSAADLFTVEEVEVDLPPEDWPGWQGEKVLCDECRATIRHGRFIETGGRRLCRICAGQGYFKKILSVQGFDVFDPVRQPEIRKDHV